MKIVRIYIGDKEFLKKHETGHSNCKKSYDNIRNHFVDNCNGIVNNNMFQC